ncbi:MAG: hypothetical protein M0Z58_05190 [Nitrospiraceae bacterium]|nr:hypothetical protein [Nitrospiraceae bacterium]
MDIVKMVKKESAKQIEELKELGGKLSEKLKNVINLIPEDTRQKSVEDFLHGIRESVFGKAPRKYKRRTKKISVQEKPGKVRAARARGRGGKKTAAPVAAAGEKPE